MYDKLVAKVNNIRASGFLLRTKYDTDKSDLEKKVSAVENKIPDVSNLVKKRIYDAKISDIHSKYITTADYNRFTKNIVDNSIKNEDIVDKSAIGGFISNAELDKKSNNFSNKSWIKSRVRQNNKITSIWFKLF